MRSRPVSSTGIPAEFRASQRARWAEGQPISDLMSRALANPDLISLAAGFVDQQTLPVEPTQRALAALMRDPAQGRAALQYGTTPGYEPLRDLLLSRQLASDGIGTASLPPWTSQQVVVTAGSNQLLHLVCESLLDPGDIVLCAAPTYLVFLGTLSNLGAKARGVATDQEGMIPEALEEELLQLERQGELPRVKIIYLVSYFDNPRGITMPLERKVRIVELARRFSKIHQLHVVEDAAYRLLRYEGEDVPSALVADEEGSSVVLADTFSKSFAPGIRIGWGILPRHLVAPVCSQKGNIDFGSPNFSQHLMTKVLQMDLLTDHLHRIRQNYQAKLQAMLKAAEDFLTPLEGAHWVAPRGGLYVWLQLPPHLETGKSGRLFDIAVQHGVLYVPGEYCFADSGVPRQRNTMRLSFGVESEAKIRQGMRALAEAIKEVIGH